MHENEEVLFRHDTLNNDGSVKAQPVDYSKDTTALGSIFLYMAIGVIITAVISLVLGYFLNQWWENTASNPELQWKLSVGFIIVLIVTFIATLIIPYVVQRGARKKAAVHVWVPYIIYSIIFGLFFSSFSFLLSPTLLGLAFGLTAIIYLTMGLIGYFSKGKLRFVHIMLIGLVVGLVLLLVVFVFLSVFASFFATLFWGGVPPLLFGTIDILSMIIIGFIFLYTCFNAILSVNNLRKATKSVQMLHNEKVFFAFVLYSQYTTMLMVVIRVLLILVARRR